MMKTSGGFDPDTDRATILSIMPTNKPKHQTVLLIEDHETTRVTLAGVLEKEGCKVTAVASAGAAREKIREEEFDLVLTDLRLPDGDGMDLLTESKRLSVDTPIILITGHGSEELAVKAMQKGAFNYIAKPIDLHRLRVEIGSALRWRAGQIKNAELEQEVLIRRRGDSDLIGVSSSIQKIKEKIKQIGPTHATVLLTGESGVGKEVVAGALQAASDRAGKPFIKINVAALPKELLESELFGHERGAFTSAHRMRKGRFELADGGTLFLDEIAECPQETQIKLLRVLQEQEFERVGGSETIRTDVRLICATNKKLKEEMAKGTFREDLYFRINVIQINIPPLRLRKDDLEALVPHFLRQYQIKSGHKAGKTLPTETMDILRNYDWPGNIRELKNAIEHGWLLSTGDVILPEFLPEDVLTKTGAAPVATLSSTPSGPGIVLPLSLTMNEVEKRYILEIFKNAKGNKTRAAKMLGIGLKTLYRKLESYEKNNEGTDADPSQPYS